MRPIEGTTFTWKKKTEKVKKIRSTAVVLHNGWEMDNEAWLVETETGKLVALTTSHGSVCPMSRNELRKKIRETMASVNDLTYILGAVD